MKKPKSAKEGLLGFLKEAFSKSAGCCGAGGGCDVPETKSPKAQSDQVAGMSPSSMKPPQPDAKKNE
jgi:hypothetical protein